MNSNLEIEYKMLIEKADYLRICRKFQNVTPITQMNVYYDSVESPLKAKGIGMRIRDIGEKHLFTLKVKATEGHDEYEVYTSTNDLKGLEESKVQEIFNHLSIQGPFKETGRLTTERTEIPFEHGDLCIDRNSYYGKIDYELEFEIKTTPEEGLKQFTQILSEFNLTYVRNKNSKIQRCLNEKEKKHMKTALFCANGFEECEGLLVVDLLRRAGIEIQTVSIEDSLMITSSHRVTLSCDVLFNEVDFDSLDMIILPGGLPGTTNLKNHEGLCSKIKEFDQQGKYLAAICAAPSVFGSLGLLQGKTMTCFPGFNEECIGANYTKEKVEIDGHFITARGLGAAIEFSAKIIEIATDKETAGKVLAAIQF